jgi:hypothetical protein
MSRTPTPAGRTRPLNPKVGRKEILLTVVGAALGIVVLATGCASHGATATKTMTAAEWEGVQNDFYVAVKETMQESKEGDLLDARNATCDQLESVSKKYSGPFVDGAPAISRAKAAAAVADLHQGVTLCRTWAPTGDFEDESNWLAVQASFIVDMDAALHAGDNPAQ